MHGLYQTSQIAEGRRPGGVSIPVRRAAEGGVKESKLCEPKLLVKFVNVLHTLALSAGSSNRGRYYPAPRYASDGDSDTTEPAALR